MVAGWVDCKRVAAERESTAAQEREKEQQSTAREQSENKLVDPAFSTPSDHTNQSHSAPEPSCVQYKLLNTGVVGRAEWPSVIHTPETANGGRCPTA